MGKSMQLIKERGWLNTMKFDGLIVDECHRLRNFKTQQSQVVYRIGKLANKKLALTGTPAVKGAQDLFGILHFLYESKFPSYWQFLERYFVITQDRFGYREIGGVKEGRKEELQELIGFISVQRKREEVMKWLPEKQYITHFAKMEAKQQKIYNDMAEDMLAYDEESENMVDTALVLTQLLRLRQICLEPRLLGFNVVGAKTKALLEWLDDNREPVVIMSMFSSYFDLVQKDIEKLGLKVGRIEGKMSNKEKDDTVASFQDGKIDVLLCNIVSAGVGFTLDRAKVIIFMDKDWTPASNIQAEDRIVPTTEEKNHAHEIISIVVPDSVDERINIILEHKQSMTDVVNNGGREAIKKLLGL
jgi:SNF2 family DNA or RNA helicase